MVFYDGTKFFREALGVPDPNSSGSVGDTVKGFGLDFFTNLIDSSTSAYNLLNRELYEDAKEFNREQANINRLFQARSASSAMDASAREAQLNRDFQKKSAEDAMKFSKEMSDTAYQRAVYDLKQAGLNPILAYTNGGASAPSGVSSSGSSGQGFMSSGSSASTVSPTPARSDYSSVISSLVAYASNQASNTARLLAAIIPGK